MAAPRPPSFYLIVSPDPTTTVVEDAGGYHYFIKFGDGNLILPTNRYSTHNPSYNTSVCLHCDGAGSYVFTAPGGAQSNDQIGKFLQKTLFRSVNAGAGGLVQRGATEWYTIRPGAGGIVVLNAFLMNLLANLPNEHLEAGVNNSTAVATMWAAAQAGIMNGNGFH